MKIVFLFCLLALLPACSLIAPGPVPNLPADTPGWVAKYVGESLSKPVENPPAAVYRYEYKGQVVYYIPSPCCDQYNRLYNAEGQVLCAPDGGITGRGDGKCPDFQEQRRNEKLVWQDTRSR